MTEEDSTADTIDEARELLNACLEVFNRDAQDGYDDDRLELADAIANFLILRCEPDSPTGEDPLR